MQELQANTLATVLIGPFVDKGDGVTPEEGVTLAAADSAEVMKHNGTTFVDIAGAGGNQATLTHKEKGMYTLAIPAAVISDEGRLTVFISDESVCLPVWKDFMVLAQAAWISKYTAKDSGYMDVDVKAIAGTATPNTSGKLHVLNGDGAAITAAGPTKTEMDNAIATIIADTEDLQTILGTPANFMADLSTLETRLSAARAGYLDQLDFALQEAIAALPTAVEIQTEMEADGASLLDTIRDELANGTDGLSALKALIDAIQTDLGDFSGRTNNKSLLAVLGVPDTAGKDLHTLLVTDRLDSATFGLSAIEGYVDCLPAALGDIVTKTEASVVDAVWDEALTGATHNIATSAGRRLRQAGVDAALIREDTCQGGGTASNVILDTGASGTNNYYDHMWIYLTAGTGAGQVRTIHDYVGNTFTGDVYPDWLTTPDATSEYAIISLGSSHVHELENLALAQINAELDTALADIDLDHLIQVSAGAEEPTDGSYLDQVMHKAAGQAFDATTDSLEAIRDRGDAAWITGGGGTAADIADAVWDELEADHQTADTMGAALTDATEITLEED